MSSSKSFFSGFKVELLNGPNYFKWDYQAQLVLQLEGLWTHIDPNTNETKPEQGTTLSPSQLKAHTVLKLLIEPGYMLDFPDTLNGAELWLKIQEKETALAGAKESLAFTELESVTYDGKEDVAKYFKRFNDVLEKVKARGKNVPDTFLGGCMINGLPQTWLEKYKPILDGYRDNLERLKVEIMRIDISYKEERIKNGRNGQASETTPRAYSIPSGSQNKGNHSSRGGRNPRILGPDPKAYCQIHKANGHDTADCFYIKKVDEYRSGSTGQSGGGRNSNPKPSGNKLMMVYNTTHTAETTNTMKTWYIDSGASDHYTGDKDAFIELNKIASYPVLLGNDTTVQIQGIGTVVLPLTSGNTLTLTGVQYAPEFGCHSLISVRRAVLAGMEVNFSKKGVTLSDTDGTFATGTLCNKSNIFILDMAASRALSVTPLSRASGAIPLAQMHRRYGHINAEYILKTGQHVTGFDLKDDKKNDCDSCDMAKITRASMKSSERAPKPGEELHIDIWGNAPVLSMTGNLYALTGTDPGSKYRQVRFLPNRKSFMPALEEMAQLLETQSNRTIKSIRLDSAPEFVSQKTRDWAKARGTVLEFTTLYTAEQNGTSERGMRTLAEAGRSQLEDSQLPYEFWEEAFATSVYCYNRCYIPGAGKTPYEALFGTKPDVSNLRAFGSLAYVAIPKEATSWHKLKAKAWRGIMTGYGGSGWRIYNPKKNEFYTSNHVIIKEHRRGAYLLSPHTIRTRHYSMRVADIEAASDIESDTSNSTEDCIEVEVPDSFDDDNANENPSRPVINSPQTEAHNEPEISEHQNVQSEGAQMPPIQRAENSSIQGTTNGRNQRSEPPEEGMIWVRNQWIKPKEPSRRIRNQNNAAMGIALSVKQTSAPEPTTIQEAFESEDKELWKAAVEEEMKALMANHTWDLIKRPQNRSIVSCKWIFKIKSSGRYKARLVARGYSQTEGVDYFETYAPVCSWDSIRLVLALAAKHNLNIQQMDVQTAFLYGDLDEEIYMEQPDGFSEDNTLVCKLSKSLYGLKQAPRVWNQVINSFFLGLGFYRSRCDPGMYIRRPDEDSTDGKPPLMVLIYVDDLLIVGADDSEINHIKTELNNKFSMTDVGELKHLLGMEVVRFEDGSIFIHHSAYIKQLLEKWNMQDAGTCDTPMVSGVISSDIPADIKDYQRLNGSINWPSLCTRPDISYPGGFLGRSNQNPSTSHVMAQKRILRYLNKTYNYGILYDHDNSEEPVAYSDSDFAGDSSDRKSTSGGAITLFGALVIWFSKKQETVALSTVEAEHYAITAILREILWMLQWLQELGYDIKSMKLKVDSMGALQLAKNGQLSRRSKHIDVKHHFIQQHIEKGTIKIEHVSTKDMIADILTKPLDKIQLEKLRRMMGVGRLHTEEAC